MARPSLKAQRSEEILDAFTRCIAAHGIQGSSLERIAEEAGLARQILRHYIGNRDDLILALAERFVAQTREQLSKLSAALPETDRLGVMLDLLFSRDVPVETENLVADALLFESKRLTEVRTILADWFAGLNRFVATELKRAYPGTPLSQRRAVATAVVSLLIVADSLQSIVASQHYQRDARRAAGLLVDLIGASSGQSVSNAAR